MSSPCPLTRPTSSPNTHRIPPPLSPPRLLRLPRPPPLRKQRASLSRSPLISSTTPSATLPPTFRVKRVLSSTPRSSWRAEGIARSTHSLTPFLVESLSLSLSLFLLSVCFGHRTLYILSTITSPQENLFKHNPRSDLSHSTLQSSSVLFFWCLSW